MFSQNVFCRCFVTLQDNCGESVLAKTILSCAYLRKKQHDLLQGIDGGWVKQIPKH